MRKIIVKFANEELSNLYQGEKQKGKPKYQENVVKGFLKAIRMLEAAPRKESLFQMKGLNFEALSGNKVGFYSVRATEKYRIEFTIQEEEPLTIITIYKLSNHYSE